MSGIDKTLHADAEEIAAAIGKKPRWVQTLASNENWASIEEKTRSRHPKKWFVVKQLPPEYCAAVVMRRIELREQHAKQACDIPLDRSRQAGDAGVSDRLRSSARNSVRGKSASAGVVDPSGCVLPAGTEETLHCTHQSAAQNGMDRSQEQSNVADECRDSGNAVLDRLQPGERRETGAEEERNTCVATSNSLVATGEQPVTERAGEDAAGEMVELGPGLPRVNRDQYNVHRARKNIVDFLQGGTGPMSKRIVALNQGYKGGSLSTTLTWSYENAWEKRRDNTVLSVKTYENWCKDFKARGHYAPLKRQKDYSIKPWHPLALALRQRPQGSSKQWVYNQLVAQLGEDALPDYTNVCRWLKDKASQAEQDKGRYSGSQLRARRFYQHRTSEGLVPASLMHADGWNSHFTAPHPVTGEFVTYEIWHAHDVATRYVPKPGIGLTENWQVILKCVENFVRELGIPARVQTDSTKVVKGSDRFTKAVHSLEERLGMTWTHPVTVGNSQANGIAENFNTSYLDKRSRELATYQNKNSMDKLSFKRIRKLTHDMVKAAGAGNLIERDKIKHQIEKIGKGLVFESFDHAVAWIERIFNDYNDRPHAALPRVIDATTGKRRHQTPREALQEHIAQGWEPVALAEHELIAEFRPHVTVTIRRDTVTPWGGMRYYHPVLASMSDKPVIVAYDLADYRHVWVKDIDGTPICTADFVEATRYHAMSAQMAEEEKRAQAALKRLDKKRDAIIDRIPGEVLTLEAIPASELPGMNIIAKRIEETQPLEVAATIPEDGQVRYLFWRDWNNRAEAGEAIPESLTLFIKSFPRTTLWRTWDSHFNDPDVKRVQQ